MITPITAPDARRPPATARTCGITSRAESTPTNDDHGGDAAPEHPVAGQRGRRRVAPHETAVDHAREHERHPDDDHDDGQALPTDSTDLDSTAEPPVPQPGYRRAVRAVLAIFVWSRLALWGAAIFALLVFVPNRHPNADRWDSERLHELGYGIDVWARWDSDWYLRIAEDGYSGSPSSTPAFFPLYPGLVAGARAAARRSLRARGRPALARRLRGSRSRSSTGSPQRHLGEAGARRAVLYLAVFPTALFLQAVYSESLYLALVLGAFLLAERGRFLGAGARRGARDADASRRDRAPARRSPCSRGVRPTGDARLLELAVALPIAALYPLLLGIWIDEPFAFLRAQEGIWERSLSWAGPFGGLWEGVAALFDNDPARDLALNVQQLAFTLALPRASRCWPGAASARRTGSSRSVSLVDPAVVPGRADAAALDVALRARRLPARARARRRSARGRASTTRSWRSRRSCSASPWCNGRCGNGWHDADRRRGSASSARSRRSATAPRAVERQARRGRALPATRSRSTGSSST